MELRPRGSVLRRGGPGIALSAGVALSCRGPSAACARRGPSVACARRGPGVALHSGVAVSCRGPSVALNLRRTHCCGPACARSRGPCAVAVLTQSQSLRSRSPCAGEHEVRRSGTSPPRTCAAPRLLQRWRPLVGMRGPAKALVRLPLLVIDYVHVLVITGKFVL